MPSELELEIQQHLVQYSAGEASLAEFEDWFAPILWDIDEEDRDTREWAGTIHILISEFSRGDRTLQEFRDKLAESMRMSRQSLSNT
jgi:hypothetical protein